VFREETGYYLVTRFSKTGSALLTSEDWAELQATKARVEAKRHKDITTFFIRESPSMRSYLRELREDGLLRKR